MTAIYFSDPESCVDQLIEADARLFAWHIGAIQQRNIDPLRFMSIHFGHARPWKLLVYAIEGAAEYNETSKDANKPAAVYPVWRFEYGYDKLRDYCERPVGEDIWLAHDETIAPRFRPVLGQPHKVVIYDGPELKNAIGKNYFRHLRAIKLQYPHVEFIIATNSYRVAFGAEFDSIIIDPAYVARNNAITIPAGRNVLAGEFGTYRAWIRLLGFNARMLGDFENRVLYNIESLRWAHQNYKKNVNFRVAVIKDIDITSRRGAYEIDDVTTDYLVRSNRAGTVGDVGDGIICDSCSLAVYCKLYREGAVCSVASSSSSHLAEMFGTRDASIIIDGLLDLTKLQAKRVQLDLEEEEITDERLPQTDKRIKDLFEAGVKVAKLIDPKLSGPGVNVNVGVIGGAAVVAQQTPQELMARAVSALEARGIAREDITPEMIGGLLEGVKDRALIERTIEGELA